MNVLSSFTFFAGGGGIGLEKILRTFTFSIDSWSRANIALASRLHHFTLSKKEIEKVKWHFIRNLICLMANWSANTITMRTHTLTYKGVCAKKKTFAHSHETYSCIWWRSLSSLLAGFLDSIQCPYRGDKYRSFLVWIWFLCLMVYQPLQVIQCQSHSPRRTVVVLFNP